MKDKKKLKKNNSKVKILEISDIIKEIDEQKITEKKKTKKIKEDKKPKKTIEEKVKIKKEKIKITRDVYTGKTNDSYTAGGSGIYKQISISAFTGFMYKSNVKTNDQFYDKKENLVNGDQSGEKDIASSEMKQNYAQKFTLNFLAGADINDISIEEKERMKNGLWDPAQKHIYLAQVALSGFGYIGTELKTLHSPK